MTAKSNEDPKDPKHKELFEHLSRLMKGIEENLDFEIFVSQQIPQVVQVMETPNGNLFIHLN